MAAHSMQDPAFAALVEAKKAKIIESMQAAPLAEAVPPAPMDLEATLNLYDRYPVGEIRFLERVRVRWIPPGPAWTGPDLFEFIPKREQPYSFRRASGEEIVPRNMITDIGSIPRLAGILGRALTPWGHAAAFLVHDWEFELHHCRRTGKSFEQVRDTMMEVVKTMMEKGLAPKSQVTFLALYQGINSFVARRLWNREPPSCTLPDDQPEV